MRKLTVAIALLVAVSALADNATLFTKYEAVRQGFLKTSVADVQKAAKDLAAAAAEGKNEKIAALAGDVAKAEDLKGAREAFAKLSDEMIAIRNASEGDRPKVAFCPMVNKSWLQAPGEIGNPYDTAMAKCGMFKKD